MTRSGESGARVRFVHDAAATGALLGTIGVACFVTSIARGATLPVHLNRLLIGVPVLIVFAGALAWLHYRYALRLSTEDPRVDAPVATLRSMAMRYGRSIAIAIALGVGYSFLQPPQDAVRGLYSLGIAGVVWLCGAVLIARAERRNGVELVRDPRPVRASTLSPIAASGEGDGIHDARRSLMSGVGLSTEQKGRFARMAGKRGYYRRAIA
jgi:hypothetical protein